MSLLDKLGMRLPIIQAPMAGIATPSLAAEVSNAGGLGSIGIGATDPVAARKMIDELRGKTARAFNVNVFVHRTAEADSERERAWIAYLKPLFAEFQTEPPSALRTIYRSFADDPEMLALLLETRPAVVSFHFGLPSGAAIAALKQAGILLFATATSLDEGRRIQSAGIDAAVAQGIEAGGHRGVFNPHVPDDGLGTFALTRLLARMTTLPVIAAGGIMDGGGIAAALDLGATAAQLGTAFIGCPESAADDGYRKALRTSAAEHTRMTSLISGRPARVLANRFTALEDSVSKPRPPSYPIAYDAAKALHAAAKAQGEYGFGAYWAGQGAPLARAVPAAELVATLARELGSCNASARSSP